MVVIIITLTTATAQKTANKTRRAKDFIFLSWLREVVTDL